MHDFTELRRQALAKALRGHMNGEVRFDDTSRRLYSTDASIYQVTPLGAALPKTADDIGREGSKRRVGDGGGGGLARGPPGRRPRRRRDPPAVPAHPPPSERLQPARRVAGRRRKSEREYSDRRAAAGVSRQRRDVG